MAMVDAAAQDKKNEQGMAVHVEMKDAVDEEGGTICSGGNHKVHMCWMRKRSKQVVPTCHRFFLIKIIFM